MKRGGEHEADGGRTPQGVRGLKSELFVDLCKVGMSHPARGAWIEIQLLPE